MDVKCDLTKMTEKRSGDGQNLMVYDGKVTEEVYYMKCVVDED